MKIHLYHHIVNEDKLQKQMELITKGLGEVKAEVAALRKSFENDEKIKELANRLDASTNLLKEAVDKNKV